MYRSSSRSIRYCLLNLGKEMELAGSVFPILVASFRGVVPDIALGYFRLSPFEEVPIFKVKGMNQDYPINIPSYSMIPTVYPSTIGVISIAIKV